MFCACNEGQSEHHNHSRGVCGKEAVGFASVPAEHGDNVYVRSGLIRRTPMCESCLRIHDAREKLDAHRARKAA